MKLYLIVFLFLFFGCSTQSTLSHEDVEKGRLARSITNQVANELMRERGLIPIGTGSGMMNKIWMLALSFDYCKPVDIQQGRELLIAAVDKYVSAVNSDARIHSFLANYPFDPHNIEVVIFLKKPDGRELEPGNLSVISAIDGKFTYKMDDPDGPLFKVLLKETYEEAVERLKESQNEKPKDAIATEHSYSHAS